MKSIFCGAVVFLLVGCSTVTVTEDDGKISVISTGWSAIHSVSDVMRSAIDAYALACATGGGADQAPEEAKFTPSAAPATSMSVAKAKEVLKFIDEVSGWWPKHSYTISRGC